MRTANSEVEVNMYWSTGVLEYQVPGTICYRAHSPHPLQVQYSTVVLLGSRESGVQVPYCRMYSTVTGTYVKPGGSTIVCLVLQFLLMVRVPGTWYSTCTRRRLLTAQGASKHQHNTTSKQLAAHVSSIFSTKFGVNSGALSLFFSLAPGREYPWAKPCNALFNVRLLHPQGHGKP